MPLVKRTVYVDRHSDLNVPDSTVDGALDWMGVAHMLDIDRAIDGLATLAARRPMRESAQISFLGLGPHIGEQRRMQYQSIREPGRGRPSDRLRRCARLS